MRDPMSRKLFMNRDAREKLRGMGGIMASSPELAQTVARFQDGGNITVPIVEGPNTAQLRQFTGIRNQLSELQARNAIMQEQLRRREAARQAAEADRIGIFESIQALDPSFSLTSIPALDRFGEIEESISIARLPEQGPTMPVAPTGFTGTARERTSEAARILIENGMPAAEVQRLIDQGVDLNALLAQLPPGTVPEIDAQRPTDIPGAAASEFAEAEVARATRSRPMTRGTPLFEQSVELLPPGIEPPITEEVRPDRTSRAALLSQMEEEMRNRAAQEESVVAEERQRAATAASMQAEAEADDRESGAARLREAQRRAAEELRRETADGDGGDGGGGPAAFDFDTTYAQMLDRVGRVMGEGAKKDDREKAMANLAMIGLAIAAGQSPDALTNIAQGALSGMQAIRAQEAREEDLAREARLTALELAEGAADRASRERVAAMRVGGAGGSTYQDPFRDYAVVRDEALRAAIAGNAPDIMEGETPIEYADRIGRAAVTAAQVPFVAGATAPTTAVTPEQAQQIRDRIEAAGGDANQLASIRQALRLRGINPADYGL